MGQQYQYYTIGWQNFVAIIHIYGARAILLLFGIRKTLNPSNVKYK